MSEIHFVRGGTPKSAGSNRMAELASDLGPYKYQDGVAKNFKEILESGEIPELIEFFKKCDKYDVHIVGSRDYVYRSEKMVLLIDLMLNGDLDIWRFLPRTLGFRDAVQLYCKAVMTPVVGRLYNWKNQPERLFYLGRGEGSSLGWHQFAKVDSPEVIWCEVLPRDLKMIEETK